MPFFVFHFSFLVNAQVVIKEKVEINPQNYLVNSPNNPTEPTFTYILSWTPDQHRRGKIQIISCYGDTTDTGWTSGGYATTSMPGRGNHIFKFVNERWYYDSYLGWGWYYDSNNDIERKVLINNQELNTGNLIGADIGTIDIPMLIFNDDICDSGFVKLELEPTNWADCEEIGWLPIDQLNLRITTGSELASFYNIRTGTNLGSQTQINPLVKLENLGLFWGLEWEKDGLDDVVIKIDENIPADSVPVYIEVKAEINGVEFAGGNIFYPDKPIIITEINPLEITTGEETSISVEVFNRCEPIDPFTTINLEIISGEEFGSLIDPYTDEKVKIITDHYLFWGYAWIDYVADGISLDETAEVKIRISTSSPGIPPKEITIYIKPSPIYAYTVPEVLGANEEANVIIKKRNPDGTLEDFPPEQTFELAVLDGCVNGNFMVGDSINVYFADAMQPIKFVTADSIDSEFDQVLIRVGTDLAGYNRPVGGNNGDGEQKRVEYESKIIGATGKTLKELREGFEKMIAEKKAEAETKKREDDTQPIEAPIVEACPREDDMILPTYWKGFASVADECDEEIVVCNNYKPPKFEDVSTITELGENDPWQWVDDQGNPQTTNTGAACNYELPSGCDTVIFGQTYIMPSIGAPPVYNLLDDMKVTVCLDKNDPDHHYWNFSLENFRVPLFSSHCPNQPQQCGYIDLGDGSNPTLLTQHIKDCSDYNKVMITLNYWIIGPERIGMKPLYKYYFSTGTVAHENVHVEQIKKLLPFFWNGAGGFGRLKSKKIEKSEIYQCPEDALIKNEFDIRDNLKFDLEYYFNNLAHLMGNDIEGHSKAEIEADRVASVEYEKIKERIILWASQQSWWCDLRIIGLYDPPNYYDCKFVPCNP